MKFSFVKLRTKPNLHLTGLRRCFVGENMFDLVCVLTYFRMIFSFFSSSLRWTCLDFFFLLKNARPETVTNDDEEALDEETKRRDQMIKGAIEVLIREYSSELNAPSQESDSHPRKKKKEKKEDVCVTDFWQ